MVLNSYVSMCYNFCTLVLCLWVISEHSNFYRVRAIYVLFNYFLIYLNNLTILSLCLLCVPVISLS